jgi:hypothetical protein
MIGGVHEQGECGFFFLDCQEDRAGGPALSAGKPARRSARVRSESENATRSFLNAEHRDCCPDSGNTVDGNAWQRNWTEITKNRLQKIKLTNITEKPI